VISPEVVEVDAIEVDATLHTIVGLLFMPYSPFFARLKTPVSA